MKKKFIIIKFLLLLFTLFLSGCSDDYWMGAIIAASPFILILTAIGVFFIFIIILGTIIYILGKIFGMKD
jgi:hypothetical protein